MNSAFCFHASVLMNPEKNHFSEVHVMTKSIRALAAAALDRRQPARVKSGFLRAYASAVETDPSLIEIGVFKLVVQTAKDEDHKLKIVREEAFRVIANVVERRPDLADHALAELAKVNDWIADRAYKVIKEKRPELIGGSEPEPDTPTKPLASPSAATAQPS